MRQYSRSEISDGVTINEFDNVKQKSPLPDDNFFFKKSSICFNELIKEYTVNSNLHGLKYMGGKDRTFVEKVFWMFVVIFCVVLCGGLISKVYNKLNKTPAIVSFGIGSIPVWQIPYPAVTICFETKAMPTKYNYTDNYHRYFTTLSYKNLTKEERNMFEDISMVCEDQIAPPNGRKYSSGSDTVNNIISVSPNFTDFFFGCKWNDDTKESCSELFSPILTEEGLCYTFNNIGADDLFRLQNLHNDYTYLENSKMNITWSLDMGYSYDMPINRTYPHRGSGYGAKAGLIIVLKTTKNHFDYLCKGPVQGFKILLHNPAEFPRLSQQYFKSSWSQELVVAIKPKMMVTSDELLPHTPAIRRCYFPNERYLRYFKIYTQANCEMECLANYTNARCGCVHFGMPHGPNIKVCNTGSLKCIKKAEMELVTVDIPSHLDEDLSKDDNVTEIHKIATECSCLPGCTSIDYETETSQAEYDWRALFRAFDLEITEDLEDQIFARVMIFFKEPQFIKYGRYSELYGLLDFVAYCGGLLGLFMGFSVLSLVEIIYFLTLRLCCVIWRRQSSEKKATIDSSIYHIDCEKCGSHLRQDPGDWKPSSK